jgi:hypothetical protein
MTMINPLVVAAGTVLGYRTAVLASGPRVYWPLDDLPGSPSAHELIGSRSGTVVGGVTFGQPDPWAGAGAAVFDGLTGFIYELTYNPVNNAPWSIEMWTKTNQSLVGAMCFSDTASVGVSGGTFTPAIYFSSTGMLTGFAAGLTPNTVAPTVASNDNNWHHYVFTFDGTSILTVYRDGVQVAQVTCTGAIQVDVNLRIQIGCSGNTARGGWFYGSISHVAHYNRALPLSEIQTHLAAAQSPSPPPPPLGTVSSWLQPIFKLFTPSGMSLDLMQYAQNGIAISQKDLGAPTVREVTYDRAASDGTDDQTRYLGQRVVAITGKCFNTLSRSRTAAFDLLTPFLDPQARCKLQYQFDSDQAGGYRELRNLRIAQFTRLASSPTAFDFQVQWKADPVSYDTSQSSITLTPTGLTGVGRTYSLIFPRVYPTATGSSPGVAVSNGTYKTWPIYRIYGPCTNPQVQSVPANGLQSGLVVLNLTIASGQYVEIDTLARTVMLGGPTGSSRYNTVNFPQTVWAPLQPGNNTITFTAGAASNPCSLTTLWSDAFLS